MKVSTMNSLTVYNRKAITNTCNKNNRLHLNPFKHLLVLCFILMMVFGSNLSFGQLLTQDFGFTGALNANGWTVHSGAASNVISTTTGLSYTGAPGSGVGNAALVNNLGGEDINISFANQTGNGTNVYYSFMVRVTDAAATKSGDYFLHIGTPGGASFANFAGRVYARITASGVNFGINNTSTATYGATNFSKNVTYFVIVKYTINTGGNDNASLWVVTSGIPATEVAAGTPELTTTTLGQDAINTIALRQGSSTTSPQTVVDGIRVGATYADIINVGGAPVVTPASPTGTVGVSFSYNIVASNSPTTYALSSGSFPPGLTLTTGPGAGAGTISGTPTTAGSFTANVTATNGGGTSAPAALTFTINPGSQTITGFPLTDTRTYTAALQQYNLTATGGASGNAVTYVSNNTGVASIVGSQVTINGAGTANITASQAGNANYNAATNVVQVLTVNKAIQTISFGALADRNDVDPNFQLTATGGGSGNPVTYTSSVTTVCTIVDNLGSLDPNGSYVDIISPGQTTITASQAGNANYLAATAVQQVQNILNTSLLQQTITFGPLSNLTYGDAASLLTATGGGSGNPIVYTSSNTAVAIISDVNGIANASGSYVKVIAPGTTTITANQAGNGSYNAATPVQQSLTVNQKPLTITGATANNKPYDGTNAATITGGSLVTLEPGDVVTFSGGGTFAGINAGTYTVTGALVLGGAAQAKYLLTQPTFTASILQASQTITFTALAPKIFGDVDYTLTATGGASGNPVTFSSLSPLVTITGNSVHINGAGTALITASQLGNTNYSAATNVSQSQVINQASQVITFPLILNKTTADAPFSPGATSTSLLAVSYGSSNPLVATTSGSTITIVGSGIVTITATQAGNADYLAAIAVTRTFAVTAPLIAAWDFTGAGNYVTSAANLFNANLNSSNLITRGSTAATSTGANSFRTVGFKNEGISVSNTDYFQTTLSAAPGMKLSLTDIAAKFNGTASYFITPGVTSQFAFSLNGTTFTLIGSPVTTTSLIMTPVNVSGISALQNVLSGTTVTIRYYASGQTTTGGWGFSSAVAGDYGLTFGGSVVVNQCTGTPASSTVTGGSTPVCSGSTVAGLSLSTNYIDPGITYQWASSTTAGGPYTTLLGTAATQPIGTLTQTTYYVCTITCTNSGLSFTTAEKAIVVNPLPTVGFTGLAASYCENAPSVTLTGSPAGGEFTGAGIIPGNLFNPGTAGAGGPYTITYSYTDANGCSNSSSQTVTVNTCNDITVNMKIWLQGYYLPGPTSNTGSMQPVLNNQSVLNSLATETDSVTVELHDVTTAFVDSKVAVVHTDGSLSVTLPQPEGNYFIVLKHRNSFQTWSLNTIACTVNTPLYNFTTAANQALNDQQVEVETGVWAIYTGDLNHDDFIDGSDFPLYDAESASGGLFDGTYTATDMNGDGFVDGSDFPVFDLNSSNGASSSHP